MAVSMNNMAYWMKGKDVIPLNGKTHIDHIIENPDIFGLDRSYIEDKYKKYNERIGQEGKAREEIMKELYKDGWIRIRFYYKENIWVIQTGDLKQEKKNIYEFIEAMMYDDEYREKYGTMDPYDKVIIADLNGNREDYEHIQDLYESEKIIKEKERTIIFHENFNAYKEYIKYINSLRL